MCVVVTGTLGFDYIMDFPGRFADRIMPDKIHKISLSFLVNKLEKQLGGTAGNIAYNLKLLGVNPYIVAPAGNDFAPYLKFLENRKISTVYIQTFPDVTTGSYFVVTDQDDNQIGSFYAGATKYANDLSINTINPRPELAILAPTSPEAMKKYGLECQDKKIPYLFDPAFQIDAFTKKDLKDLASGAYILIGNDYEISLIEKKLSVSHSALVKSVPILITTLGQKGSIIETPSARFEIAPASPENSLDPTGAGDAFRGGFVAGLIRGFDLQTCGQMGSVSAVYTVEKYGTMTHEYSISQYVSRYFENYHQELKLS